MQAGGALVESAPAPGEWRYRVRTDAFPPSLPWIQNRRIMTLMSYQKRVRAGVSHALNPVLEPGDEVVADMLVKTGPTLALDLAASTALVGLAVMALALSGWRFAHSAGGPDVLGGVLAVGGLLWQLPLWLRKPVFVVVTRRQLVCFLLGRLDLSGTPRARMFAVPLTYGSITRSRWSLRYTGPDGETIRLNKEPLAWHARRDMNEMVAALRASGVIVESGAPHPGGALRLPASRDASWQDRSR
jgi:hypothetical protein